jgi:predicted NBD/HSP70 family sugar kinase
MRGLARIIRIAHAIYRPQHVTLAGGIGIRVAHLLPALRELVNQDLTRIAREDWTLEAGEHDFHAATGAARLAARNGSAPR